MGCIDSPYEVAVRFDKVTMLRVPMAWLHAAHMGRKLPISRVPPQASLMTCPNGLAEGYREGFLAGVHKGFECKMKQIDAYTLEC